MSLAVVFHSLMFISPEGQSASSRSRPASRLKLVSELDGDGGKTGDIGDTGEKGDVGSIGGVSGGVGNMAGDSGVGGIMALGEVGSAAGEKAGILVDGEPENDSMRRDSVRRISVLPRL